MAKERQSMLNEAVDDLDLNDVDDHLNEDLDFIFNATKVRSFCILYTLYFLNTEVFQKHKTPQY